MEENSIQPKGQAGGIPVFCSFDKIVPVEELKPNPKNPNRHPGDQVELLAKVIEAQGWRQPVKVSNRSGLIVSGHGRYEAALLLGCPVPVDFQEYPGEAEELSDLLADNRIAELSDIDNKMLSDLFAGFDDESIDICLTGYTQNEIDGINDALSDSVMLEIDDIKSKSQVSTHKMKIDNTMIELTDEEYDSIMEEHDKYINMSGTSFGFVRWLLNDD